MEAAREKLIDPLLDSAVQIWGADREYFERCIVSSYVVAAKKVTPQIGSISISVDFQEN